MAKGKLNIDVRKSAKAVEAIHDILFLDYEGYNGNKQWDVDMLARIAEAVAKVVPRPPGCDVCDECERLIPQAKGGGLANKHHAKSCSLYVSTEE